MRPEGFVSRWRMLSLLCASHAFLRAPPSNAYVASPLRPRRSSATHTSRPALPSLQMVGQPSELRIFKDIVVVGGGLAGLSISLELARRGRQVTVLSRDRNEAAAEAAGGMIAPQAERLESGTYLDLCLSSRAMYAEWVSSIEAIAGLGGHQADTHFWSSGGILSPAFDQDAVHLWHPPSEGGRAHWVDKDQALEMEPTLSSEIVGAWWFPQDMSIDAQRMFCVLEQACAKAGVEILQGTSASSLVLSECGSSVDAVLLEDGRRFHAKAVVAAAGAWMRDLMPVPMLPHKGQMMALRGRRVDGGAERSRQGGGLGLTRVFFAEGCYIIPKRDGRVVVGSTVEVGEYGLYNTPAGVKQIIDAAIKVVPALADLSIERTWAGLRPTTPDTLPVLGASARCPNLFVAGGYWRNGVLLAPKTAQLVADAVCGSLSPPDEALVSAFTMDRFTAGGSRRSPRPSREGKIDIAPEPHPQETRSYVSEISDSEMLEMERAALEGSYDGNMLSGLNGLAEDQLDEDKVTDEQQAKTRIGVGASVILESFSSSSAEQDPVNDYVASSRFSESSLKEARMANRAGQDRADVQLEALFGHHATQMRVPDTKSWEDGAEEVATILGAQIVEMDVDIRDDMTEDEALREAGPIVKVLWESPSGEDIEIPKGSNLAAMVSQGIISPEQLGGASQAKASSSSWARSDDKAIGTFDPEAVRGAEERSPEVADFYAKVVANKAKLGTAGSEKTPFKDKTNPIGRTVKESDHVPSSRHETSPNANPPLKNSWTSAVVARDGRAEESLCHRGPDRQQGLKDGPGVGAATDPADVEKGAEMVGYDFILQDRTDSEGKAARSARAASRDAPEGEAAWSEYEDIAREAIASVADMEAVEYLPPL